jgi:uncharacterized membrane protein YidH (DUF202 family)
VTIPDDAFEVYGAAARTSLAWRRSGLSLVACGFVIARGFGRLDVTSRPLVGMVVVAIGAGLWAMANVESRRRARAVQGSNPAATRRELAVFAGATALAGVITFILALSF